LLLVLAAEARGLEVHLSQPELAARLGLSERALRRQELELERLDIVQVRRGVRANRRVLVLVSLAPVSALCPRARSPQPAVESCGEPRASGRPRPVSPAAAPGRNKEPRARREDSLEKTSPRSSSFSLPASIARIGAVAARVVSRLPGQGSRRPDWPGPSPAVDDAACALHEHLGMYPNTLREVCLLARDICIAQGELRAVGYIEALALHCSNDRRVRNPGGAALEALRQRAARASRVTAHHVQLEWGWRT
jgi:hypothetical protein